MFDIGWGELVVIGVVALIAIGPKELPGVLRMVGQWTGKIRRMASEFQGQFQEALREAEMADVKQHFDDVTRQLDSHFDPLESVHDELQRAVDSTPSSPTASEPAAIAAPAESTEVKAATLDESEPAPTDVPSVEPVTLERRTEASEKTEPERGTEPHVSREGAGRHDA